MGHFSDLAIGESSAFNDFLQELLDEDELQGAAAGITKLVIDKGEEALSEKQERVFQAQVVDKYLNKECSNCGVPVPISELSGARENSGRCSYCIHKLSKDD